MKNILIYGASGHAKMIVDIIHKKYNYTIKGFIDSYKHINQDFYGFKVIGNLDVLPELIKEHNIHGIVIAIGDNYNRQKAYHNILEIAPELEFVSLIHPSAVLANDIMIPKGVVIMANAVLNANAKVGEFCILNTKSSLGHDCVMADFSSLASGATLGGNIKVGICSAICISASIMQNVTIGDYTVIGAASLVLKSIGDLKQAFGVPINTITDREPDSNYLG